MKLNPSQLNTMVHNVLSCDYDENGGLHLHRFTPEQREIYGRESAEWVMKIDASASATLDFVTDSDYITLRFDLLPGSSQKWGSIDLYVDGVFYDNRYAPDLSIKLAGFRLPEGEHRVTVYFPWSAQTVVQEVRLSDGAVIKPVEKKCKLLCFGDSITQGYTSQFASMSYVSQVTRALDAEVVNQGIGAYYFNEATLDDSLLAYDPDIITVAYGTNDYSRYETPEEYAEYAGSYIKKLASMFPNAKILGILPIYRNDKSYQVRKLYRGYDLDDARQILKSQYEALPNGYVLEQTGIAHIPQAYAPDFLHPNEFGFTMMAQGIIRKLKQL